MQGLRQTKIHITGRHQQRCHHHNDGNAAVFTETHNKENTDAQQAKNRLLLAVHRRNHHQHGNGRKHQYQRPEKRFFHSAALQLN